MAKKSKKQRRNEAKRLQRQAQRVEANMRKAQERVLANKLKVSTTRKKAQDLTFDLKVKLAASMSKYNVQEAEVGETPYQVKLWVKSPKKVRHQTVYVQTDVVVNMSEADYKRYEKIIKKARKEGVEVPVITPEFFGNMNAHLTALENSLSPEYTSRLNSFATFNFLSSVVRAYPPELQYAIGKAMIEHPELFTNERIGKEIRRYGRDVLDQVYGSDNPETDASTVIAVLKVFPELEKYYEEAVNEGYSDTEYRAKMSYINHRALRTFED